MCPLVSFAIQRGEFKGRKQLAKRIEDDDENEDTQMAQMKNPQRQCKVFGKYRVDDIIDDCVSAKNIFHFPSFDVR